MTDYMTMTWLGPSNSGVCSILIAVPIKQIDLKDFFTIISYRDDNFAIIVLDPSRAEKLRLSSCCLVILIAMS